MQVRYPGRRRQAELQDAMLVQFVALQEVVQRPMRVIHGDQTHLRKRRTLCLIRRLREAVWNENTSNFTKHIELHKTR